MMMISPDVLNAAAEKRYPYEAGRRIEAAQRRVSVDAARRAFVEGAKWFEASIYAAAFPVNAPLEHPEAMK